MTDLLLGVDAGTTNIKAVAATLEGEIRYHSARPNEVLRPEGGWEEQDMDATWEHTCETVAEVTGSLAADEEIVAVGITGQGDGCWTIDDGGEPVRNAILWSDGRAADIITGWQEDGTADAIAEICGSATFPGTTTAILAWLQEHEPGSYEQIDTVFYCKDWIKYHLTHERTTDYTDASLPFLDVTALEYSDETLELCGVPQIADARPRLVAGPEHVGRVTAEAARETGLSEGVPVVSGVIDIVASAFGSGAATAEESSSVVGTTSLNQTLMDEPNTEPVGIGFTIALGFDSLWTRAMASMTGTPNLDWVRETIAPTEDFDEIEAAVREVDPGSGGVVYQPFLSSAGERAPFLNANARAGFQGIEPGHDWPHLLRSVYEGVALAMRDCYAHIPRKSDRVAVSGGGSRSPFWCQLFADCLETEIVIPAGDEFGAKGVALLAGVGAGCYPDLKTAVERTVSVERTYPPRDAHSQFYAEWYDLYTETYEALFEPWDRRSDLMTILDGFDADQ